MNEQEQWWYFTFGYGQKHGPKGYAKYWGTHASARTAMIVQHGIKWSFQYPSKEKMGKDKWNLKEVKP